MKRWSISLAMVAGLVASGGGAVAAPPEPVDEDPFPLVCPTFVAEAEVTGKAKTIDLPGGRFKVISPNLRVTVTNPENEKSLSTVITGVGHYKVVDGVVEVRATGRNILILEDENDHDAGLFLTIGNFSYLLDAKDFDEIEPFSGKGRVIDVCAALA